MFHVKHSYHHHKDRSVILIQGEDQIPFLQGLITNDMGQLSKKRVLYTALLTSQGRFLFDFFLYASGEMILLECLSDVKDPLLKKLNLYKLRAHVTLQDVSDTYSVYSIHNVDHRPPFVLDPRCAQLGYRAILKTEEEADILADIPRESTRDAYESLRLSLGIPETLKDMIPEKSIPLECGLDQLNAISWSKGCYVGQELTARTHYRGVVRKRLLPVKILGEIPQEPCSPVFLEEQSVGTLYSRFQQGGIARLNLEEIEGLSPLTCGKAQVIPYVPSWMNL